MSLPVHCCVRRGGGAAAARGRGWRGAATTQRTPPPLLFLLPYLFLYESPLTYSCERDCNFFLLFACAVYRYFGYLLFFRDYKTGPGCLKLGLCAFFAAPLPAVGCRGCSQLENYSLPTPAEPAFRYFCLLWIMSDDFSQRPVSFVFTNYFFYRNYKSSFLNRVGIWEWRRAVMTLVAWLASPRSPRGLTRPHALTLLSDKYTRLW